MRKDTAWVAVICLILGGLIGYLLGVQIASKELRNPASVQTASQQGTGSSTSSTAGLPEGHPPIVTQSDIETLKKAVEAAPKNAALLTELANKLYDAGRYQDSVGYYRQVLELDPNNVNVITDLGTALFYSGKPEEAITQYNRSLEINPRHAQSLHNLVIVNLQGKKDIAAATAALNRLKVVEPNNPSISGLEGMLKSDNPSGPNPASGSNPRQRIF